MERETSEARSQPVVRRTQDATAAAQTRRLRRYASEQALARSDAFEQAAAGYMMLATPTVGDLLDHVTRTAGLQGRTRSTTNRTVSSLVLLQTNIGTRVTVQQELRTQNNGGVYGRISREKPDNVVCLMYENFSSLSLFVKGVLHHKKIRQLNALAHEYNVNLLAGCKTRTDWRFVENKEDCFCNLFGGGKPTRGSCAFNTNNAKIKRDQ